MPGAGFSPAVGLQRDDGDGVDGHGGEGREQADGPQVRPGDQVFQQLHADEGDVGAEQALDHHALLVALFHKEIREHPGQARLRQQAEDGVGDEGGTESRGEFGVVDVVGHQHRDEDVEVELVDPAHVLPFEDPRRPGEKSAQDQQEDGQHRVGGVLQNGQWNRPVFVKGPAGLPTGPFQILVNYCSLRRRSTVSSR